MKRLERLILVNWYLFEKQQIDLRGNVLIVGTNGAGKTSLLDALQVVLLGGDGKKIKLNANAASRTKRDIQGYILGKIREEDRENPTSYRAREDAISHIAMVFRDTDSGEETTVGACLSAKNSIPGHQILWLYIADGEAMCLNDFIVRTKDGEQPIEWENLRQMMKARSENRGWALYQFGHHPEKFVAQLCSSLAPTGRVIKPASFTKALRKAINLKDIDNVSDFVRNFVLDDRPLDISQMDRSVATYKEMLEAAKKVSEQIESLSVIGKTFRDTMTAARKKAAYAWIEKEHGLINLQDHMERLEETIEISTKALVVTERNLIECDARRKAEGERASKLRAAIDSDNSKSMVDELKGQIVGIQRASDNKKRFLDSAASTFEKVAALHTFKDVLEQPTVRLLEQVGKALDGRGELGVDIWPPEPAVVDALAQQIGLAIPKESKRMLLLQESVTIERHHASQESLDINTRLQRMQQGGTDLSKPTLELQALLAEHGIKATPLCELAEVTDTEWQPAIEMFLGNSVETLFVEPSMAEDAVRIYRRSHIRHASVINTVKTGEWRVRVDSRSCATMIRSENQHVLTFLKQRLGQLIPVESEHDLMHENTSITKDGMLNKGARITRNSLPQPKMGSGARERAIDELVARAQEIGPRLAELNARKTLLDECSSRLTRTNQLLENWHLTGELKADIEEGIFEVKAIEEKIEAIDLRHLEKMEAEWRQASGLAAELDREWGAMNGESGRLKEAIANAGVDMKRDEEACERLIGERQAIELWDCFDMTTAAECMDELTDPDSPPVDVVRVAMLRQEEFTRREMSLREKARMSLSEFRVRYNMDRPAGDESLAQASAWVAETLRELEETELADYLERAEAAHREAQIAFREDVAANLKERIQHMRRLIDELNKSLKDRPFSGNEVYQFRCTPSKERKDILDFIDKVSPESQANVGGLFDRDTDMAEKLMEMIEESVKSGKGQTDKAKIAD